MKLSATSIEQMLKTRMNDSHKWEEDILPNILIVNKRSWLSKPNEKIFKLNMPKGRKKSKDRWTQCESIWNPSYKW